MRPSHRVLAAATLLTLTACKSETERKTADTVSAPAALEIANVRRMLLENESAEAFTITLEPGQSVASHEGTARVVYSLSDYRLRYTQDGESRDSSWRTGDVHAHVAGVHGIENIGTTSAQLLIVARRPAALPAAPSATAPTEKAESGTMNMRLDDDGFRVSEVSLAVGATLPRHPGLARVVYSLSDYTIRYVSDGAEPKETSFRAGEAHWHDADQHVITNIGTTEARFLIVQFKR
jgi:quercetin dioxygenase-like cupin family protein